MTTSRKSLIRAGIVAGLASLAFGLFTPVLAGSDNAASKWKVWTYNPSNRAFKGSVPATTSGNVVATFAFPLSPDTALLITDHGSYKGTLLGDLTGKTVKATVSASAPGGLFTYYGQGTPDNPCGTPASVRFFFQTKSPASFAETDYWWSNPVFKPLATIPTATPMSAPLSDGHQWSDFNGHFGDDPVYAAAFQEAVKNVTSVGLSFGGGCFFENGVGAPNGGSFTLWSFSTSP
jgi:hypothetical protein